MVVVRGLKLTAQGVYIKPLEQLLHAIYHWDEHNSVTCSLFFTKSNGNTIVLLLNPVNMPAMNKTVELAFVFYMYKIAWHAINKMYITCVYYGIRCWCVCTLILIFSTWNFWSSVKVLSKDYKLCECLKYLSVQLLHLVLSHSLYQYFIPIRNFTIQYVRSSI